MKKNLMIAIVLLMSVLAKSQTAVVVDPNAQYQTLEGWGVSLAWWANVAGGWSDAKIDTLCTWLTSPTGLNMNVFRFDIAGGENPSHSHMRVDATLQGYKISETAAYDFKRDSTQRKFLLKLKSKRSDCIFSAVSYSPPYWMTKSNCASGDSLGADNLKDAYYDDFADYLTEVVKYYHDSLNVTFKTLAPVNEPSNAWAANGVQEGCHFSSANLVKIYTEVYNKLQAKTMSGYCSLSAMECYNARETYNEINKFSDSMLSKITQINTHSYTKLDSITQYQDLYNLAKSKNKKLWMSESGPLEIGNYQGFQNNLKMTDALIRDMRNLKPVAWCDWQYLDQGNVWGHVQYDSTATFKRIGNYYARMQVTRFIKPGYTLISSNDAATLAAINPGNDSIVLVINNSNATSKSYQVDLNLFGSVGSTAQVYRTTSHGMEGAHWKDSAYNVYTYQTKTGLSNGTYTAKAWVLSSGGQANCYFAAKGGGDTLKTNILKSDDYVQVTISNISVTNGQCTIGFYSDGPANKWCAFDNVELYRDSLPGTNHLTNPKFENDTAFTQTPNGWSTGGSNANADYVQSGGRINEACAKLSNVSIANNIFSFTALAKSANTFVIPASHLATAPIASGNYRITAKHSNKDMSVAGWSENDGGIIEQWAPLGQGNQVFNVQWTPEGYKLLPSYNAKAVTVNGYSSSNGAVINQWSDLEQANQRFSIVNIGGGYYKIVAKHSNKCLAVTGNDTTNGADVVQWAWVDNNQDNFKWKFTPVPLVSTIANGTYNIKAKHSSKMMSIVGWSEDNGAVVEQWDSLCQDNLKFDVTFDSSGYIIKPSYNSKVVSVNNNSVANGAAVVQWDDLGYSNQRYQIVNLGGGYYKIVCRYTNKCLAVKDSSVSNGGDIVQWEWKATGSLNDNLKWAFKIPCATQGARGVTTTTTSNNIELLPANTEHLRVYPNPSTDYITIQYSGIDNARIQLFDMNGKLMMTRKGINNNLTIKVGNHLSKGMYMLKISGSNKSFIKKIIVQ